MVGLPPNFWADERRRLLALLLPKIESAALVGVLQAQRKSGIGINLEMANRKATEWARAYTDDLLSLLGTTSEKLVGDTLSAWIETPGATMGDLARELTPKLAKNRYRADLIAVTETTRAISHGEKLSYQQTGISRWRWNTNNDELVCKYCGPINGKVVVIGTPFGSFRNKIVTEPPFHPGCRCWVSPVVSPGEKLQPRNAVDVVPIGPREREVSINTTKPLWTTVPVDLNQTHQVLSESEIRQIINRWEEQLPEKARNAIREVRLTDERNTQLEETLVSAKSG